MTHLVDLNVGVSSLDTPTFWLEESSTYNKDDNKLCWIQILNI